jgi:hypothetical protein
LSIFFPVITESNASVASSIQVKKSTTDQAESKIEAGQEPKKPTPPFRDQVHGLLQEQGYTLGSGDVYAGEYVIYKDGDPSNTHSIATVRCHTSSHMTVKELLAFSRVQNQASLPSEDRVLLKLTEMRWMVIGGQECDYRLSQC